MNDMMGWALLALAVANLALAAWVLVVIGRTRGDDLQAQLQSKELQDLRALVQQGSERLERELRHEVQQSSQGARQELGQTLATFQQTLTLIP